jgi:hypothetical protein
MIAPADGRAPRMLLLICEDEQGLPMEIIRPEPSLWRLHYVLRIWLAGLLPARVGNALRLMPVGDAEPPAIACSSLIDVRMRWAGL